MNMIRGYRERSLRAWTIGNLINAEMSIQEKMTLFWHNHFVVQFRIVRDPIYMYNYISLLRENALGIRSYFPYFGNISYNFSNLQSLIRPNNIFKLQTPTVS